MIPVLLTCIFLSFSAPAYGHPVNFKGGLAVMSSYDSERADTEVNYSLTRRYAVGVSDINIRRDGSRVNFVTPQFNYLLARRNELESQSNLYIWGGPGWRSYRGDDSVSGLAGFQADYETRRIYTLFSGETLQSSSDLDFSRLRYRAGFAPYLASYEGFHTWIIGQVDYMPDYGDRFRVTPLLRFFYNNILFEAGSSTDGDVSVNLILHFYP